MSKIVFPTLLPAERAAFRNAHFAGEDYQGCSFESGDLSYTIFENCNFNGARFVKTELFMTQFIDCNLSNTDFALANLTMCKWDHSNARNVSFHESCMIGMEVIGSQIEGAYTRCAR